MGRVGAFPATPLRAGCNEPGLEDGGHGQSGAGVNGLSLCFGAADRWESLQPALGYI